MDINNHSTVSTDESVSKLALSLLDVRSKASLLDIGSGLGDFLSQAYKECPDMRLFGVECNEDVYRESLSRLPKEINIRFDEAFTAYDLDEKFDRIFCHPPWGMETNSLKDAYNPAIIRSNERLQSKQIVDWLFCDLICRQLTDDGMGVVILPLGNAVNSVVRSAREDFVKQGWIKTIVLLPSSIHYETAISTVMIVFSKGNQTIRMVDARDIGIKGRRQVTFSDADVNEIANLCDTDAENSCLVGIQKIEENDYILNPARYTSNLPSIPYAIKLEEVVNMITRGAGLTSKERDELTSQEDNGIYFLTVSDIENINIKNELSIIKEVTPKMARYVLNDGDIILSKNGAPFKTALYEDRGKTVIANGNMYVMRVDESRVNPHYLVAFLNSDIGQKHLENIAVGSMFFSLAIGDLKKMPIPLPTLDVQEKFAQKFRQQVDELERLKHQVRIKEREIKDLFMAEIIERRGDENI